MGSKIRIMLADDHEVMRSALRSLLDSRDDLVVVAEAGTGREVLSQIEDTMPDVVVMDINMPELNGIETTRQLCASYPQVRVLGLSIHANGRMVSEMLNAGASGYVPKNCAASELLEAIHLVRAGKMYISPEVLGDFVVSRSREGSQENAFAALTEREREVLQLLAEGFPTKEVAEKLSLGVPTVHTHRQHLMQKLNARSVADLVRYAIREGIVSSDT
ncbi:MAG: response regulator transcription factor [Halioglobus sp.]|nr:response regulator transcription factor [Halioglobus sp.]